MTMSTLRSSSELGLSFRRGRGRGADELNSDTQPESQPIDSKTHYTPNIAKFLLWEGMSCRAKGKNAS